MSRSSPGVQRVVAILNFLADHPDQSFTLTDLVRALRLSRATCHSLLAGLVDAGYVYRSTDKSYVLGPGLVAIGRIANQNFSPIRIAQPEMRALADEFDAVCSAVFREDDGIVIRERCASRSNLGWSRARDMTLPLSLNRAAGFLTWARAADVDAFLDDARPAITAAARAAYHEGLRHARETGFQVLLYNSPNVERTPAWLVEQAGSDTAIELAGAIVPDADYLPASVSAAVIGPDGSTAFILTLVGFRSAHRGAEIAAMGKRLRSVCDRISGSVGGREGPGPH